MKRDYELKRIVFLKKEGATLPLNHRTTYIKDVPSAEAYARARLVNTKYKFQLNMAVSSRKPISKMGIGGNEHP